MHSLFLIFVLTIPSSENENFYTQLLGYTNVYISSRRRISRVLNLLSHYKKNWSVYTKMLSKKLECCSFQYPSFEFSADELENRTIFLIRRRTVHLNYSFDLYKTCNMYKFISSVTFMIYISKHSMNQCIMSSYHGSIFAHI